MKANNRTDYIERYLNGQLKEGELWEFKIKIEQDADFAREFRLHKEINETLADSDKLILRNQLNKTYKSTQTSIFNWKYQVAAAITILIMIGGALTFNQYQSQDNGNMGIYQQYFNPDSQLFTVRADNVESTVMDEGIAAFENENYEQALEILSSQENMGAKLYTGFANMKLSKFDKAIDNFNTIINDDDNLFIDQAEYNLSLCYIATDRVKEAKTTLSEIIKKEGAYKDDAEELLQELNNK